MTARKSHSMSSDARTQNLSAAFELLKQWTDIGDADVFEELGPAAVYKTSVVLWLMLFQRLNPKASLRDAVLHFIATAPPELKTNKRLREGSLSTKSSSYSDARHRLSLKAAHWFQERVASSIVNSTAPTWGDRRVFLIDGTTFTLAPVAELQAAYPPASNQYGESVWPIAYVVFAHELSSGAAVPEEIGAMYGPNAVSETRLAQTLMKRLPAKSIIMADAGFGIFSTAYHAHLNGHNFVLRLKKDRFNRIRKRAELIHSTATSKSYRVSWTPSAKERVTNPDLPSDCVIAAMIHELKIGEESLYLVEDIDATPKQLRDLYWKRNDIEVDIRNIKLVIGTEEIRAKSKEMFLKEFALSMVAYNLATQLRRQAAVIAECEPRELSFTGVWSVYRHMLQGIEVSDPGRWIERLDRVLHYASKQKLPNRPGRSYPREAYARRPKTTHFQKRRKKSKPNDPEEPTSK
ncbi:IS4 family transposase [Rosistilla oblonga]|uniref:IS4 family transposase n=1 Tax=Rosistilla oblonga TaxID=2527990 RepID=UPI001E6124D7|nr:IS4 family transposase [Rosistilla oblonga]